MKQMPWFRLHSEARCDPKLEILTDAQFRVWFRLLCFANDQPERGNISFHSMKLLAVQVSKGDEALLRETLAILADIEIISLDDESLAFLNWNKRQYDKPSDTPEATKERQSRHRSQAQPHSPPVSRDVTPSHAQEREREEKEREDDRLSDQSSPAKSAPSSDFAQLVESVKVAANIHSAVITSTVRNYAPKLKAMGKDIVHVAATWREANPFDSPTGNHKNLVNWLEREIQPLPSSRGSPTPAADFKLPPLATGMKRPTLQQKVSP